jgi:hypothetical protein
MKVLDCGCGVGGPMRTIASVSGAHVTGKQHTYKTPLLNIDLCSSCLGGKEMGGYQGCGCDVGGPMRTTASFGLILCLAWPLA